MNEHLTLGLAQISPIWLNKDKTIEKIIKYIDKAGNKDCDLVCFGESLLPGYPFWVEWTNGAKFQSEFQKMMFAHYHKNAISVEHGDLDEICEACAQNKVAAIVGTIEKAHDRGGHSLYCSLIYISKGGKIENVEKQVSKSKKMPQKLKKSKFHFSNFQKSHFVFENSKKPKIAILICPICCLITRRWFVK